MGNTYLTPNMSLIVPVPGSDPGPDWAYNLNADLTTLDGHNHTPGSGVFITPAAINMNADLTFNAFNATTLRSVRFNPNLSLLSGAADLGCLYESGVDLYYNDGSGNQIRITQSGSVSGASGTITGLPSGTASASYAAGTFTFDSATSTPATLNIGPIILQNPTPGSYGITLSPPNTLAANYQFTFPGAPPATTLPLLMNNSGTVTTGTIDYAQLAADVIQALNPPGTIIAFAGPVSNIPTGYLLCDGSPYSRTTYAALFAAIGVYWGYGDNSTTFNVPQTQGLFLRGNGGEYDPDASSRGAIQPGGATGQQVGTFQNYNYQSHTHGFTDPGHNHNALTATAGSSTATPSNTIINNPYNNSTITTSTTIIEHNTTGASIQSNGGDETRPVNVYVTYCIKY